MKKRRNQISYSKIRNDPREEFWTFGHRKEAFFIQKNVWKYSKKQTANETLQVLVGKKIPLHLQLALILRVYQR